MKLIFKIFFISCFFISFQSFSQTTLDEYLASEELRIQKVDSIEQKINEYIVLNFSNYNLTQEIIDEIAYDAYHEHDGVGHSIEGEELQELIDLVKKTELRKLYLYENPGFELYFEAIPLPNELRQTCVNGGFESGYANYNYRRHDIIPSTHFPNGCTRGMPSTVFSPSGTNNFGASISLVTPGNEPLLASLGININRVKSGNRALKINPTPSNASNAQNGNSTTAFRNFVINEPKFEFSFLQLGHVISPSASSDHYKPAFRFRIVDANSNVVLYTKCYTMDTSDCRYSQIQHGAWGSNILAYTTNWICESINTSSFIGRSVRVEFNVQDCGYRGHFSTVYIDDICGVSCEPTWGSIEANPININCPTSSFNFCGTYSLPTGSSLTSLSLNVLNSSNSVVSTLSPSSLVGNNFCFTLNPSDFGASPIGNYNLQVVLNNTSNCSQISQIDETFGTVSFNGCCLPTLTSASPNISTMIQQERSDWISSSDNITFGNGVIGNGVVYHAGNYVELTPGFDAIYGSQFSSYIEGCTGNYIYKTEVKTYDNVFVEEFNDNEEFKINLIKVEKRFKLIPNPANNHVKIVASSKIKKIILSSIDGRQKVFENINDDKFLLDVSNYSIGIYIITVFEENGNYYSEKLIKN